MKRMQNSLDGKDAAAKQAPLKDCLYYNLLNWYLKRSLVIQIEEKVQDKKNYIEFVEYVEQPLPLYHDDEQI